MHSNIRIILVAPSHPGNIGAVARAMKTMELDNLYLVSPKHFPHVDATARAAGADDILANAIITDSLAEAVAGSQTVFGTSSRLRALSLPRLDPRQAAKLIKSKEPTHLVSIVFGRENNGLANEEMELCNHQVYIPTNPDFYSLNLASAVQLIAYEIKMAGQPVAEELPQTQEIANAQELQSFYKHLQQILVGIKFSDQKNPRKILSRLKLLFNRARLEQKEVKILRGILSAIQSKLNLTETGDSQDD